MIHIYINDEEQLIKPEQSLLSVLTDFFDVSQHFAVAINQQLVPKKKYASTFLNPLDHLDIIVPMQGG